MPLTYKGDLHVSLKTMHTALQAAYDVYHPKITPTGASRLCPWEHFSE